MDVRNKKPEDFMYDCEDVEWTDENTSDYWKELDKELDEEEQAEAEEEMMKTKHETSK